MTLQERDKKHLWHPLTQHKLYADHLAITKAKGALLFDDRGNKYIDGIASWYTCMYGHCNDYITNRVANQMKQLDQVVFAGFTHEPAIKLSEELMKILPKNQQKIFFSDNGSTAVDVALKMALQYHFNKGEKRGKIIALENGFHGDTFGAMSVSGLSIYNGCFEDFFIDVARIPVPSKENFESVKQQFIKLLETTNVAAFIYEPLVQGAAAMKMYDAHLLDELLGLAKQYNTLTIADEVMTGFGKTGKYFASEYLVNQPDIICMAKSLTGGLVPMAITSCTQNVYDAFLSEDLVKGFFHGHTYSANPIACTAALAGIELLQSDEIKEKIKRLIASHQQFDKHIKEHPKVKETRQLGVIYALDINVNMERYGSLRDKLFKFFMNKGVFLRPLGNTIYMLTPYIITDKQLEKVYNTIEEALEIV
ncbi:MAG: adenosylmethionine--8-amino-7-oxononanoate transaminase [Flavobacteriaceae bacterium]|nr:adenosylmethionine--8-amino-7-oxononanoate transaminase [Flavobacteriaceae bacterium]